MVLILKYNKINKKIYFRSAYIRDIFGDDFSQEQIDEMSTEEIIEHVTKDERFMEPDTLIVGIFSEELDIEYYDPILVHQDTLFFEKFMSVI